MTFAARLSRFFKRRRLRRELTVARNAYAVLSLLYDNAVERGDCRDQGRLSPQLQAAATAVLRAERALYNPDPLPRPAQPSKARGAA